MASDRTDSDPVLATLRAKVAAWQAAVDSYLAARATEGNVEPQNGGARGSIELPVNAFRGMTMTEAIKLFMKSVQRKQTTAEIADGLKSGGFVTTAKDIAPTLRNALAKLKHDGVLLRFPDGWDLAEAHSAMVRHRVGKETNRAAKKRRKSKHAKVKAGQKPDAAHKAESKATSLDDRVRTFLAAKPNETFVPREIADGLGLAEPGQLSLVLARLVRYQRIVKRDDGRFQIAQAA